jgi:hypothetical protein
MNALFRDKEHLFRMGALFVGALVLFLILRAAFVPKGFGAYGHYRAGALADNREHAIVFAGQWVCEDCHSDVALIRKGSKHERIACEACHGAQSAHASADDPAAHKPKRPDAKTLCFACHLENVAKPKGFPQVNPKEHGDGGPCSACHKPHHPEVS